MLDRFFFLILVLNATGLFAFIAPQVGTDIGTVSIALLGLQGVYLVERRRYLTPLLRSHQFLAALFVLLAWPVVTVLYAPVVDVRQIGLQFYYASLFVAAVVYARANGLTPLYRILAVSLAVSVFGLVLSMTMPGYFASVTEIGGGRSNGQVGYLGRAFGFFMQPNSAGHALCFLFVAWYALWKGKESLWEVAAFVSFLLAMFLTGSRTSLLVAVTVVGLILISSWRRRWRDARAMSRMALRIAVLTVFLLAGVLWTRGYLRSADIRHGGLLERISALVHFRLSSTGNVTDDDSVQIRLRVQEVYWSRVKERPLWGYGLGAEAHYLESGFLDGYAHSGFFSCWMEFGVFYPIAFILLIAGLHGMPRRHLLETRLGTTAVLQFALITILLFIVNGTPLAERPFFIVWGMFFAAARCPDVVLPRNIGAGALASVSAWQKNGQSGMRYGGTRQARAMSGWGQRALSQRLPVGEGHSQ